MGETFSKREDDSAEGQSEAVSRYPNLIGDSNPGSNNLEYQMNDTEMVSSYLERDLTTHYNECNICGLNFTSRHRLRRHALLHASRRIFSCNRCESSFQTMTDLKIHMKTHPTVDHPFECNFCDKSFECETSLYDHMKEHSGVYIHTCDICFKIFTQKSYFMCHMWTHTEGRPHKCHFCDKIFLLRSNLRLHVKAHSYENDFNSASSSQIKAS